ncbi:MAG: SDR family NAD(P)-dependent oxidoreductase [Treponema sp.]|nr:SDR family NAD(P)-dependent oxidoreductase [Treponema sp.]MBR5645144.1 SDR family NAD(P)-dependent oxidoreductase [Treponema sp.]
MNIAVVTGASSGMGREFCRLFDKEGFDEIWGLGLGKESMEALKTELSTKFRYFDMDLTVDENLNKYKKALEEEKPDVKWLVNASGFGKFGRYDEIGVSNSINMIDLNCRALVFMTETTLPYMSEGARITQFASIAAFQPLPYINIYSATKVFILNYSLSLGMELKSKKITVTAVCPYWTKTAFFDRATKIDSKTSSAVVTYYTVMYDPEKVINKAYKDSKKGKSKSVYGFTTKLQATLSKLLPAKLIMNYWLWQQKLRKKYKGK